MFNFRKKTVQYNFIKATNEDVLRLEKGSAITFNSYSLDRKIILKLLKFLQTNTGLGANIIDIYTFTGKDFNELYNVNCYEENDNFLCFELDNWTDINKLAYNKGVGRWLDDIVDNIIDN